MLTPRMGHAGSWSVSLDHNGQSDSSAGQGQTKGHVWVWQNPAGGEDDSYEGHGSGSGPLDMGQTQTGSVAGNFTLVLRWTPSAKGEKIPPFVGVWFWQEATGEGGRSDLGEPNGYNGQGLRGTPGSVTLTTRAAAPDGKSYSDATHAQKAPNDPHYTQFSSYSVTPVSFLTISTQGASPTHNSVTKTDGSLYVTYAMPPLSATLRVTMGRYPDPAYDGGEQGDNVTATVGVLPHYALDPHQLWISSDIEPSYKKFTAPLPPAPNPLPDYCYRKNPDGSFKTDGAGSRQMDIGAGRPVLWADSKNGLYAIQCQRNPDGSVAVESAAKMDSFSKNWFAWNYFTANTVGFPSRTTYKWSLDGSFVGPEFHDSQDNSIVANGGDAKNMHLAKGINSGGVLVGGESHVELGGSSGAIASSSSARVNVADPNGVSLASSYNINWHYPFEPYHKRPNIHHFTWRTALSQVDDGANFSLANGAAKSQQNPYQRQEESFVPVAKAGMDGVDQVSGYLPAGKDIAEILTKLGGKAVDWYVEKNFPTKSQHFTNVAEAWAYSIQHQQSGNSEGDDPAPIVDLVPSDLLSDPDGWIYCTHQVFEIVHTRRESWDADAYNGHGYVAHNEIVNADEALGVTVEIQFKEVRKKP